MYEKQVRLFWLSSMINGNENEAENEKWITIILHN